MSQLMVHAGYFIVQARFEEQLARTAFAAFRDAVSIG
jgi:hypothetical protein